MSFIKGRILPVICGLFICCLSLPAQESIFSSYERTFIRASLPQKNRVLTDAASDEKAGEFVGSLYAAALEFALENGRALRNDSDMIELAVTAARGVASVGNPASGDSARYVKDLWELFQLFDDPYTRVEFLGALAVLGNGNRELIGNLNRFLSDEIVSFKLSGSRQAAVQDYPVVRACINSLGILGDSSSFPVLFTAMTAGFPQAIVQECLKAMDSVRGGYQDYLVHVIRNNPFPEKAAAFRIGAYNEKFSPAERGELAQAALEVSLENSGPADLSLRYDAITVLTRLRWTQAAPLAVRNLYKVQSDFSGGIAPKNRLLEAIACLGVMASADAARVLSLQLGFINSQTERSGEYDEDIVLALISSLGELADKAAFDNLLYIGFLNYPDKIQAAAREALNRLKW